MKKKKNHEGHTKKRRGLKIALCIAIPLMIIAGIIFGIYTWVNGRIYVPEGLGGISDEQKEEADYEEQHGIINILMVGLDGRDGKDNGSRTDSIILATINTNTKSIKLTSFMRDMYVKIPDYGQNKINAAYAYGGADLLIKTINSNFNLNVQYYVSIDFAAFQGLVDALGGVDVEIKDHEVDEINYYIQEADWSNTNPDLIPGAGYQHLSGAQALSYCRIRKVGNNDYERTERQRRVLSLLIQKARTTSATKLPGLFNTLIKYVKTNMPTTKLMNIGYTAYKFGDTDIGTLRIPATGLFVGTYVNEMSVLIPQVEKNALVLQDFIYSNAGSSDSTVPEYLANNFHKGDEAVDKREDYDYPEVSVPTSTPKPSVTVTKQPTGGTTPTHTPTPTKEPTGETTPTPTPSPTPTPTQTPSPTNEPIVTP
jgi:LCP family protein required for cell wall assembly